MENQMLKRNYNTPCIEQIEIDTDISLQLNSNPPYPVNENNTMLQRGNAVEDPFKMA